MRAKQTLLWALILALVLPMLACASTWALAAMPGNAHDITAPVLPGYTLELNIRPCDAINPGRMAVWYIDTNRANRFIRERFVLLLRTVVAPPCPAALTISVDMAARGRASML